MLHDKLDITTVKTRIETVVKITAHLLLNNRALLLPLINCEIYKKEFTRTIYILYIKSRTDIGEGHL